MSEVPVAAPKRHAVPDRPYRTTLDGDAPCGDCGTDENIVWFTDSVFWNNVCTDDNPILCLPCFIRRAEAKGFQPTGWRISPEWPWRRTEDRVDGERAAMSWCAGALTAELGRSDVTLDDIRELAAGWFS